MAEHNENPTVAPAFPPRIEQLKKDRFVFLNVLNILFKRKFHRDSECSESSTHDIMRVPVNTPCHNERRSPQPGVDDNDACYNSALNPNDILEATRRASREYQHFRRHFRSNDQHNAPSSGDASDVLDDENSQEASVSGKIAICRVPDYDRNRQHNRQVRSIATL